MVAGRSYGSRWGTAHFSPSGKKLASASALSSFMVRKIRCQTHLSQGPPPPPHLLHTHTRLHLNLLTGHVPILAVWFGVHLGAPSSSGSNPHMNSKHFTVYLITIQIVPVLVWMRGGFFVFFLYPPPPPLSNHWSLPGAYDPSMRLTALDQVGQPVSVGIIAIKVESKGNSMFAADSDWWWGCFITNAATPPTHNKFPHMGDVNWNAACAEICFSLPRRCGSDKLEGIRRVRRKWANCLEPRRSPHRWRVLSVKYKTADTKK